MDVEKTADGSFDWSTTSRANAVVINFWVSFISESVEGWNRLRFFVLKKDIFQVRFAKAKIAVFSGEKSFDSAVCWAAWFSSI